MFDAGELYGWGYLYMHKILNRVFKNYGPIGLKRETKYIIQYLNFILNKLNHILSLEGKEFPQQKADNDCQDQCHYVIEEVKKAAALGLAVVAA